MRELSLYNAHHLYRLNADIMSQARAHYRRTHERDKRPYSEQELRHETIADINQCFKQAALEIIEFKDALVATATFVGAQVVLGGYIAATLGNGSTVEPLTWPIIAEAVLAIMSLLSNDWRSQNQKHLAQLNKAGDLKPNAVGDKRVYEAAQENVNQLVNRMGLKLCP